MGISDLLFPRKCLGCRTSGVYLCQSCLEKIKIPRKICLECERPSVDGMTHIKCKRPLSLNGALSLWRYEGIVRQAIIKLKYQFAFDIAQELVNYMCLSLDKQRPIFPKNPILVPIPLHKIRGRWRGFNQTEEIGKLFALKLGWNFFPDLLVRKKAKRPQTELKGRERWENVRGVFALNPNYKLQITNYPPGQTPGSENLLVRRRPSRAGGKSLIIFDDVWTTGATLKEATKVIKRNGVKEVWGLTIAR